MPGTTVRTLLCFLLTQLKHHALVEAARQYDELQAELQSAQAELAEYHNLPASQVREQGRACASNRVPHPMGCVALVCVADR